MKKNKELTDYCKAVKKNLHCSKQLKKEILHALESDIEEYLEQNPDTTAEDVREHFGDPADFARESLSVLDDEEIQRQISKSKFIKRIVLIAVIIICLVFTTTAILVVMENSRAAIYYYSEEIGEYE